MAENKELKVSISSNLDATGFNQAQSKIKDLSAHSDKLSASFKTFAGIAASLGAVTLFKEQITQTLEFADSLNKLSQKTGVTVDGLYSLSAAAKLSDVDFASLEKSLSKFSKGVGEASMGTGSAKDAFDRLGVSIRNQDGTLKDSFTLLVELSDKFQDMPNGASKATTAMELFGKSGADIIPLLNSGSEALRKFTGIIDQDTAQAAEEFNDSLTTIGLSMNAIFMKTAKELSPTLTVLSNDFLGLADDSDELGSSLSGKIATGMKGIVAWGYGITSVFETAGNALGNFAAAASFALEMDWKKAAYSWNRISTDFDKDIDKWSSKLNNLYKADEEHEKKKEERAKREKNSFDYGLIDKDTLKKQAEDYEKALIKINDAINKNSLTAYEYGVSIIEKEVAEYQKAGISKAKIDEYVFNAKMELGIKQLEEETKQNEQREKEVKAQYEKEQDAMLGYYKAVGMESDAFYLEEVMKLQKLADAGILSNSQMLEIWAKDNEKFLDEQFKKNHEWLYDMFDNINKALDESFFDTMTGKFKSFGDWLKDFFSSIGSSIARGLSRTLAGSLTDSLQGGIVNSFKSYGLFGGASLVGSTLSASDMNSLISSGATASGGKITTSGGTIIDQASGMVTNQGSDALSLLNTASSLKTVYNTLTGGISSTIMSGFNSVADILAGQGYWSAASGVSNFGYGVANPFSYGAGSGAFGSTTAGAALSGTLMGGLAGYGIGSLGDKIFGASTYAGTTGAIGGALGGLGGALGLWGGPIGIIAGSIIGSVLGGIFGKTKQTGAGIDILGNATAQDASGQYWQSYSKKSWFSSKSWTNYTPFSDEEIKAIKSTIGVYDYLLEQLGNYNDLVVSGGRFSNLQSFLDTNVVQAFLVSINPSNLSTIYQSWVDYAAEIDKTITEAISTAVSGYTTYKRGYTEWFLGSGTVEQLAFTSNYLQKDFEALASSLGASSVTVDNFLSMYDAAIKNNFTQDTIEAWASLGDALMKSTDATKKYKDALDSLNGSTTYSLPVDTMLTKVNNTSQQIDLKALVSQQNNQNESIKSILFESLKSLKQLLKYEQMRITQ